MLNAPVKRDPHTMFAGAAQRYSCPREHSLAQLAACETAEKRNPGRTSVGVHVRAAGQITINRNLIDVVAELPSTFVEKGAGPQRNGGDAFDGEAVGASRGTGREQVMPSMGQPDGRRAR